MNDTIYRQRAINALKQMQRDISGDFTILDPLVMAGCGYIGDCIGVLEILPPAPPRTGEWIPVAERLPERRARVLTCSKDGDIWINDYSPIAPTAWAIEPWAVIAWMSMPESYTEDNADA